METEYEDETRELASAADPTKRSRVLFREALEMDFASNKALNETLIRSLNNSMTIVFMLLALTLMSRKHRHWKS